MIERLYQPDFSCIFGEKYTNAFLYGQVDSLIWPIFNDIEKSGELEQLLKLKNQKGREYFYHRNISMEDEIVELNCANIDLGLIQGMDLGRDYGISNLDVIAAVKKHPKIFRGILSYDLSTHSTNIDILSDINQIKKEIKIAGIVLYPSYTKLDLLDNENLELKKVLNYCNENNYFVKIDVGNLFIPDNHAELTSYAILKSFFSRNSDNIFILSGLDVSGDFNLYYQLLKYFNNVWIEIDSRTIGGMTPTDCFKQLFDLKGFIQNCWHRLLIGSATPTLEISQMVRGFLEATEKLLFSQKCILRTWAFRNVNRLNFDLFPLKSKYEPRLFNTFISLKQEKAIENNNEVEISYRIKLRSNSITQLIYLSDLVKEIFNKSISEYPDLEYGELFVRSYHTTTTLIINEHEFGNYLDLHYKFAEISKKNSSKFLHTLRAQENRADFNHYDHELASTYGSRQLTLPILNKNLEIGKRENFYVLVTFGPRTLQLLIRIRLIKE
ncbi:MAG: YjbQ family protein [Promethearchaeota archaeon]